MKTLALSLLALSLSAGAARAEQVAEPSSGHNFDSVRTDGGKKYVLTGAGIRKKIGFKVYAMGLWMEDDGAKKAAAKGGDAAAAIAQSPAGKIAVLHFVRSVGGEKMRDAFIDGFGKTIPGYDASPLKKDAETFIALFDADMADGEEIQVQTGSDGKIEVWLKGKRRGSVTNGGLVRPLWEIWLGDKPITSDLKKGLVSRLAEAAK